MCGIAGLINLKGQDIELPKIEQMIEALSHRGPDGFNSICEGNVALGHRRLAIFDLSEAGQQPMNSPDGRYAIVHNGEIYNWPEIRKELDNKNWLSRTDTETILHAYMERGVECLQMFNGVFAFAIYDRKEKKLFLARDRIGIKPIFYGWHKERFYFASEMKALFAAGYPKITNYALIYDFLRWGLIDHSYDTFFTNIVSLEPGHYFIIDTRGRNSKHCYWNLAELAQQSPKSDMPEIVDQYSALLKNAIELRMRADVPVGVFLSGGVDSSILASRLVQQTKTKEIEAYTYEFETGTAGEGTYAKEVADWLGLRLRLSVLKHKEVPDYFPKVLYHEEMPVTSLRVLALHKLYEEYKDGSTVVLEGHGGDQVGAGFEYYIMPYIMDVIQQNGTNEALLCWNKIMDSCRIPSEARYQKLFNYLGATLRVGASTQDGTPFVKIKCLSKDFINGRASERINFPRPFDSHLLNAQYVDLRYHNLPRVLRYVDRGSMAVGREARVPILDHRIVELGFRSTENSRVHNGEQRYFMRQSAHHLLPKEILDRPKRSIVDPMRRWLQHELKDWVLDIFHSSTFRQRGIFNQKEVIREYERYCTERMPVTGFHIFQYINVELWFRTMVDSSTSQI